MEPEELKAAQDTGNRLADEDMKKIKKIMLERFDTLTSRDERAAYTLATCRELTAYAFDISAETIKMLMGSSLHKAQKFLLAETTTMLRHLMKRRRP